MGRRRGRRLDFRDVRRLALALPGVVEGASYGTPAFRVGRKLLARMLEDGESLVVKADFDAREALVRTAPDVFEITDHYRNYPMVVVRLPAVRRVQLAELLEEAWRREAPRRLIATHDSRAIK